MKVTFPILETVVSRGDVRTLYITEGQGSDCVRCGQRFRIDSETITYRKTAVDRILCVKCPHCEKIADVYYYLREPPRPKIRHPIEIHVPWMREA